MRYLILLTSLALAPLSFTASAADSPSLAERMTDAAFTAAEKTLIEEYFGRPAATDADTDDEKDGAKENGGKSKKMPKGLAKRDRLPPGLEKQIEKNGTLPPGLAKRDLPADLARRLPKRDDGTEPVIVDSDVVLIETATGVVVDILRGVVGSDAR